MTQHATVTSAQPVKPDNILFTGTVARCFRKARQDYEKKLGPVNYDREFSEEFSHWLLENYGVSLILNDDGYITNGIIQDEQKYMIFCMRYN